MSYSSLVTMDLPDDRPHRAETCSRLRHLSESSNMSQHTDTQFDSKRKELDRSLMDQHLNMLCFYGSIGKNNCLWAQHFDRRCICDRTV